MSRSLKLLPCTSGKSGTLYSFDVVTMPNDDNTLERISRLSVEQVSADSLFFSHMGETEISDTTDDAGEHHFHATGPRSFGDTHTDGLGLSIRFVTAGAILQCFAGDIVPDHAYAFRAVMAYLGAIPASTMVALYWG